MVSTLNCSSGRAASNHPDRNTQNERKATQSNAKQRTQGKQNQRSRNNTSKPKTEHRGSRTLLETMEYHGSQYGATVRDGPLETNDTFRNQRAGFCKAGARDRNWLAGSARLAAGSRARRAGLVHCRRGGRRRWPSPPKLIGKRYLQQASSACRRAAPALRRQRASRGGREDREADGVVTAGRHQRHLWQRAGYSRRGGRRTCRCRAAAAHVWGWMRDVC